MKTTGQRKLHDAMNDPEREVMKTTGQRKLHDA